MTERAAEREGKLRPMSFRTTWALAAKLEQAASKAGRSLTSEIERRLALSFGWEQIEPTPEVLEAAREGRLWLSPEGDLWISPARSEPAPTL